jgi:alkaline phosphatase
MHHGKRLAVVLLVLAVIPQPVGAQTPPKRAKNVILFLADAAGIPTLNAASLHGYQAPLRLHVQGWPHLGLSDTTPVGGFVSDSANGMTAIVTGEKTRNGVISEGSEAVRGKKDGHSLKTILEYAEEKGLLTGVVTHMPVGDATPAACYAHNNERGNEAQIFKEAFTPHFGDGVDVLIGGGRADLEAQLGKQGDSIDAVGARAHRVIYPSLEAVPDTERRPVVVGDPIDVHAAALRALAEMQKSPRGYFLMIEWDAHTHDPKPGLEHVVAFDKLIREIEGKVNLDDTLLLFTADHSFALRVVGESADGDVLAGYDDWKKSGDKMSTIRLRSIVVENAHSGEEVAAIAVGAGSERVHGFFPNTYLFHVMLDAWGWKADPSAPAK